MKGKKILNLMVNVFRVIVALTFIFSGFVKSVDPWGTAIKFGEYLAAFDLEYLYRYRFLFAIWLNGAEIMMGLMFLFKVRIRLVSTFVSLAMIFFTCLTFVIAIWNPVEDCGCFGEAIKLTNWETFIKNLILLPMSLTVWWCSRKMPIMPTWRDGRFMLLFATIAFGIGTYSYIHLPIIDFLPYKKGTDLVEAMNTPIRDDVKTTVIYRNKKTGKEKEFKITDTEWYDEEKWEYVDTRTISINRSVHPSVRDFAIFDEKGAITEEVLHAEQPVYMIFASSLTDIKRRCEKRLEKAITQAYARGYNVVCITADPLSVFPEILIGEQVVRCYNMDATTIKTVLRAKVGVVVLKQGVIVDKVNCADLLEKGNLPQY